MLDFTAAAGDRIADIQLGSPGEDDRGETFDANPRDVHPDADVR